MGLSFYIFGILKTIIWFSIVLILGAIIHFIYRIKTHTYTKSWMDFKVIEKEGKLTYGRISFLYYTLVVIIFLIATITILLVQ
jgi:cytochrome c biogenesis factor